MEGDILRRLHKTMSKVLTRPMLLATSNFSFLSVFKAVWIAMWNLTPSVL
jgi:hypothetical protein